MKLNLILASILTVVNLFVLAEKDDINQNSQQLRLLNKVYGVSNPNDFRKSKNIGFVCHLGGSSHVNWILSIMDELQSRGHSMTFITKDDHVKYGKQHPTTKTFSLGENVILRYKDQYFKKLTSISKLEATAELLELMDVTLKDDYLSTLELMKENELDLVICDHQTPICADAAMKMRIPFLLTSTLPQGEDTSAPYINNKMLNMDNPTTQYMNLWDRFKDKFISPVRFYLRMRNHIQQRNKILSSLGINPTISLDAKFKYSVKMFNTAFGFQSGRPLGPYVELIGPIINTKSMDLTPELENFMLHHQKIVYIAFGQFAHAGKHDISLIMTGLLEAYEAEEIDGIIWATRGVENYFPSYITTRSNTTYDVRSFFTHNNQSDIIFLDWAPQLAILNHPSTSLFVTHGGSGSIYESLYSGVRLVVYPFYRDQPAAANMAEHNGVGIKLSHKCTQEEATEIIIRAARDDGNVLQKNVDRYKALVRIKTESGVRRGADVIEEVLFMHEDGKVTHRRDVKDDMSYVKANNLDLYAVLISMLLILFMAANSVLSHLHKLYFTHKIKSQ